MLRRITILSLTLLTAFGSNCSNKNSNGTITIEFLIELFNSDRLTKDKTLLDRGFEIGNVDDVNTPQGKIRYEGYLKEGWNVASEKFEFIHYSTDGNYWLEYMTTNSKTTSSILGSIQSNHQLNRLSEDVFQNNKSTIVIDRKTIGGFSVYSIKVYETNFYKTL